MKSMMLPRSKLSTNLTGWRGGSGPELLLIHGVGLTADAWSAMVPVLTRHFSVTAIDLPGHGGSAHISPKNEATLVDYSAEIAAVITGPLSIVGHSLGALIGMEMAISYPNKVTALITLNSIFRRTKEASLAVKNRAAELSTLSKTDTTKTLERWFGQSPPGSLEAAREHCDFMLRAADPEGYAQAYRVFASSDGPADNALQTLEVPMLCVTGSDEPNSTPAMSHALAASVRDGQAVTIEGARHMMPMTHADEVNRHIVKFAHSKGLLNV